VTETQDVPTNTPEAPQDSGSFLGNLFNLYFEPGPTFAKIFVKPRVLLAILLQTALGVLFATIWLQKADLSEVVRQRFEQNPRIQQMPAEQVQQFMRVQTRVLGTSFRVAPFIAPALGDLIVAGILMFVFRFFLAADVSFSKSFAIVAWSLTALALVQTPIILAVLSLKGDWNVTPDQVVQANPTLFFQMSDVPMWVWGFLSSFDLFSAWLVFLLASGYAVAGKLRLGTAALTLGVVWAIIVFFKVAFLLMFG
jgi:hypothetical protein